MLPWSKKNATQNVLTSIWLLLNNLLATVLVQASFCLAGLKNRLLNLLYDTVQYVKIKIH